MSRTEKYLNYFLSHRNVTLQLVSKIEKENYEYKPTPTSMTTEKLVSHMLTSFYRFALVVKKGDLSAFSNNFETEAENLSDLANQITTKTVETLQSLTEEELNQTIDLTNILGMKLTGSQVLQVAMDHEIHHKGALFIYVRELGHTDLPMFVSKG
ncbi:DinB family protein [Bacillus sp. 31A1R]|uniref:DinB family protein n=1 Tax=Robertmurraya mangrovi TaxID=3098077 RepID=A0ABU5J2V3_9BACI|nr:DinB family protein [Bacillus sp. 31A1R]MDZ5473738.1 DinB family protein [Bacillus sp. 31A1R]